MTTVYCFSGSGHSMAVASKLAELLGCALCPIEAKGEPDEIGTAVVVFPVYCQNLPKPVKAFLKRLQAAHVALLATYGKISYGNVLYEAQKLVRGEVIAGAYIPIGHTFLQGDHTFDAACLLPLVERVNTPQRAVIPKCRKNPLANIAPALRSRLSVKLTKDVRCTACGRCEKACPMGAIRNGRIGGACVRCLRCVSVCPENALQAKNSRLLDWYLHRYRKEEYILYL